MPDAEEVDNLRTMLTGAYNQISELKERVSDLEGRVDELEAENDMLRQAAAQSAQNDREVVVDE